MTRFIGLIGRGLKHSISPSFQQAAFDYYGLDIRYQVWEADPAELEVILQRVRHPETVGANVTVPHKEAVLHLIDRIDRLAREIGAVNTIVNHDGKLEGYNTDAGGFLKALRQEGGFDPAGKNAVLLGAGGVARAVSFALAGSGVKSLTITDMVIERANKLVDDLKRSMDRTHGWRLMASPMFQMELAFKSWSAPSINALASDAPRFTEALSVSELLVNCTPVGMKDSATEGQSPLAADKIPGQALVYDVVYNPVKTQLLLEAERLGLRTLGGLPMLVYQGAAAFELWTKKAAPIDIMMETARRALGT